MSPAEKPPTEPAACPRCKERHPERPTICSDPWHLAYDVAKPAPAAWSDEWIDEQIYALPASMRAVFRAGAKAGMEEAAKIPQAWIDSPSCRVPSEEHPCTHVRMAHTIQDRIRARAAKMEVEGGK